MRSVAGPPEEKPMTPRLLVMMVLLIGTALGRSTSVQVDPGTGYGPIAYGCPQPVLVDICGVPPYRDNPNCANGAARLCTRRSIETVVAAKFFVLSLIYAPPGCGSSGATKYQCSSK